MCGLVVVLGVPPMDALALAVEGAGARGPHQHGWATRAPSGWRMTTGSGRLPLPPTAGLPRAQVGHSRLATSTSRPGDRPSLGEAQPYTDGGQFLVAHNGTIAEPRHYRPDSLLLLAALIAGEPMLDVLARADRPGALIWADRSARLHAARVDGPHTAGHPLYVGEGDGWALLSSSPINGGRLLDAGTIWSEDP